MRYEPVLGNPTAKGCQPGAFQLARAIEISYPELESLDGAFGCFNRRRIAGSSSWSLHAEGRAIDVGIGGSDPQLAWRLACELVGHRALYGTMRVMWDAHIWTTERLDRWERLKPHTNQHHDHLHVELFRKPAATAPATLGVQVAALTATHDG